MTHDGDVQFDSLADEYVEQLRAGESPSIDGYVNAHPEFESKIRELFPVLQMMENRLTDQVTSDSELLEDEMNQLRGLPPQRKLGEYRIIREIGRGGMGIVYQAEQESLGRHVALKLLPDSAQFDERRSIRFQHEARASGMLHHSNIVPVFGVGRSDEVSYFVMQYIDGTSLDRVIQEVRHTAGIDESTSKNPNDTARAIETHLSNTSLGLLGKPEMTSPNPEPEKSKVGNTSGSFASISSSSGTHSGRNEYYRNVAKIGRQISDALDYAHTRKILHRDIKPSNLLIDATGHVWVTDFGLAKLMGEADLTRTGETVGTLRYLPPEQFNGKSDARSDVYSLGLTLYELLTLQPAFDGEDFAQLLKNVTASDPTPPRKKNPKIPRDLETIVMKAIAKTPESRYQSAGQLRDDLILFLEGKPIQAKQASELDRLVKAIKRRPIISSLVALLLVSLVVGTSLVTWKWRQAANALVVAQEESKSREAINDFLYDLLSNANPYIEPNSEIKLRTVLDLAAKSMDTQFVDQPLINAELRMLIGQIYLNLSLCYDAAPQIEAAYETRREVLGEDHPETQESYLLLAIATHDLGDYQESLDMVDQIIAWQSENPTPMLSRLERIPLVRADIMGKLGLYDEAQGILEDFVATAEVNEEWNDFVDGKLSLAWSFYNQDKLDQAQQTCDEIMPILTTMVEFDDDDINVYGVDMSFYYQRLEAMRLEGSLAHAHGRFKKAIEIHRRAYELTFDEQGPDHATTLISTHSLAGALIEDEQYAEAMEIMADTVARSEENIGADSPQTLIYKNTYAISLLKNGEVDQALELLKECYYLISDQLGELHPDSIIQAYHVASAYYTAGQYREAENWQLDVVKNSRESLGSSHPQTFNALAELGETQTRLGKFDEAKNSLLEALAASRKSMRENHPNLLGNISSLMKLYFAEGKFAEAEPLAIELLEGFKRENNSPSKINFATNLLAHTYYMQDKFAKSYPLYDTAYQTHIKDGDAPTNERMETLMLILTENAYKLDMHEEVISRLDKYFEVARQQNKHSWRYWKATSHFGRAHLILGNYELAEDNLLDAFAHLRKLVNQNSPYIQKRELRLTAKRLAELYKRTENQEQQEVWKTKYQQIKEEQKQNHDGD